MYGNGVPPNLDESPRRPPDFVGKYIPYSATSVGPPVYELHSKPPYSNTNQHIPQNKVCQGVDKIHNRPLEFNENHLYCGQLPSRPPDGDSAMPMEVNSEVGRHTHILHGTPPHFVRPPDLGLDPMSGQDHKVSELYWPSDQDRKLPVIGTVNHRKKLAFLVDRFTDNRFTD